MLDVVHCITTLSLGGAEKQLLTLVKAQINSGRKVSIIFLKDSPDLKNDFLDLGAEVLEIIWDKNFLSQIRILRDFLQKKVCIVHAHLPRAELICAITKGKLPFLITKHNAEKFFPKAPSPFSKLLALYVFRRCDFCVSISKTVFIYLLKIKEIKSTKKNRIIHYGIDIHSTTSQRFKQSNLNSELKIIGTAARIVEQKDYPTLLRAFTKITRQDLDLRLLIAGDGNLKPKMVTMAESLGINNSISWLGKIRDVDHFMKSLDLFVLTSVYEGFGLVLLEASFLGVPILAAANPAVIEVLGDDYPGLFTPGDDHQLFNQFERVRSDKYRELLISAADKRLKLFDYAKMLTAMNELYDSTENSYDN